ncbi:uncharacterized protein LOC115194912 [Salmo trutta]|uniref:uncharacterized protein LOC115194912 n=1 Tax=Salmo trutta TaxID=8032 RepID=UPI001130C9BB|nr:uncharacterized protein LOC115194912 [Salmo trutta]
MMGVLNQLSTLLLLSLLPPALSHVVERFDPLCQKFFMKGTTPNLPGILIGGKVEDQNRYKLICQLFNNAYRFATLYDTFNKIPVFSAYTFTGASTDCRPKHQPWMIEPQLNGETNNPEMQKVVSFNGGSWREMEENVRGKLNTDCINNNGKIKAYVVTGAVPSSSNTLNNRVNIPDLMWTAYCCYNSEKDKWMTKAHWGENQNEDKKKTLPSHTLSELYDMLDRHYGGAVQVFPEQCPIGLHPTTTLNPTPNPTTTPNTWKNYREIILSTLRNLYNSMRNSSGRFFG